MSIFQLNAPEGPPDSAVQNRLTAAGAVLAMLFFGGSFSLQLHAKSQVSRAFAESFAYLAVGLVVGALMAFLSITCLLLCQQCEGASRYWYHSKRAWFIVAHIALYLAIAQGMSVGLTELVFGIKHTFNAILLAQTLAVFASLLWLLLLIVAPIQALCSWWPHLWAGERILVSLVFGFLLLFLLLTNGAIYMIQDGEPDSYWMLLRAVIRQLVQPMSWLDTWAQSDPS